MRKLIVSMNVTQDAFLSGPNCEMDWHFRYWSPTMSDLLISELARADTVIMGRVTYNVFRQFSNSELQFQVTGRDNFPFFDMLNKYQKIVFSKTLEITHWQRSVIFRHSPEREIRALKNLSGKDLILYGSANLLYQLQLGNVIDRYQLYVHPLQLGGGKPLFNLHFREHQLRLERSYELENGVIFLEYDLVPTIVIDNSERNNLLLN